MVPYTNHIHCQDKGRQIAKCVLAWWKKAWSAAKASAWREKREKNLELREAESQTKNPQEWLPPSHCHTAEPKAETVDRNDEKEAQPTRYTCLLPRSLSLGWGYRWVFSLGARPVQSLCHPREVPTSPPWSLIPRSQDKHFWSKPSPRTTVTVGLLI